MREYSGRHPLISKENRNVVGIPLDERWSGLRIVLSSRLVQVKNRVRSRIDQQCNFQQLNR